MTAGSIVLAQPAQCANWLEATTESIHRYLPGENQELERPQNCTANPGVNLPSLPIRVVHRSDGSGTTAVFTQHLSAISPEWKSKVGC